MYKSHVKIAIYLAAFGTQKISYSRFKLLLSNGTVKKPLQRLATWVLLADSSYFRVASKQLHHTQAT